jgi:hypothetical protein
VANDRLDRRRGGIGVHHDEHHAGPLRSCRSTHFDRSVSSDRRITLRTRPHPVKRPSIKTNSTGDGRSLTVPGADSW